MARPPIAPQPAPPKMPADYDQTVLDRALSGLHRRQSNVESRTRSSMPGTWLNRQVIAAGGQYVPTTGATSFILRGIGGGGAGGGSTGGSSTTSAAAGGNSGQWIEVHLVGSSQLTGGTVICGQGGVGSAANNGGNGGNSTIVINGVVYTATGGIGGGSCIALTSVQTGTGLPSALAAVNAAYDLCGQSQGTFGLSLQGAYWSGAGGDSPYGSGGGIQAFNPVKGTPAQGFGAGGGGATATNTSLAGGNGSPGLWMIDEFGG